jgi:hypothetical protein
VGGRVQSFLEFAKHENDHKITKIKTNTKEQTQLLTDFLKKFAFLRNSYFLLPFLSSMITFSGALLGDLIITDMPSQCQSDFK